jgi:hypothetical protein
MVDDRYMSTSPLPTLPSIAPSSSLELSITPPSGPGRKARASSWSLDEERGAVLGWGLGARGAWPQFIRRTPTSTELLPCTWYRQPHI